MKKIFIFFSALLFVACQENKSNDLGPIVSNEFYQALEQSVLIGEKNQLELKNIAVVFTPEDLHIFVSDASKECYSTPYQYLDVKINQKNYNVIFDQNLSILSSYIDTTKLKKVNTETTLSSDCQIYGFGTLFKKDKKNNAYILNEVINNENYTLEFLSYENSKNK